MPNASAGEDPLDQGAAAGLQGGAVEVRGLRRRVDQRGQQQQRAEAGGAVGGGQDRLLGLREACLRLVVRGVVVGLQARREQRLHPVGDVHGQVEVEVAAAEHAAQRGGAGDPVRVLLGQQLGDEAAERLAPDVRAVGLADLLDEEVMQLLAGGDTVGDGPAVAGVGRAGQRVTLGQQRGRDRVGRRVLGVGLHRREVRRRRLGRAVAVGEQQQRAVPGAWHLDLVLGAAEGAGARDLAAAGERDRGRGGPDRVLPGPRRRLRPACRHQHHHRGGTRHRPPHPPDHRRSLAEPR